MSVVTLNNRGLSLRQPPFSNLRLRQVQRALLSVLEGHELPPPPMTEVAKRIGHDKRIIHRHFPALCRAISAQYLSYKKQARLKRIEQSCQQVRQAVNKLDAEGIYPSADFSRDVERGDWFAA